MDLRCISSLSGKIKCIFEIKLQKEDNHFDVKASETIRNQFSQKKKQGCLPTEKIDGTSTIIKKYNGKAWLWVRRDRKLTKIAINKKLKVKDEFVFDINNYKVAPKDWVASEKCINDKTGQLIPDITGNIMGWIPLDSTKSYVWHSETVDYANNRILVLNALEENDDIKFEVNLDLLSNHEGQSFELIGTNINGNPYKIGSKKCPIHFLTRHGNIPVKNFPIHDFTYNSIKTWFVNEEDKGRSMEGIVWHCSDGDMFKLTRHHLDLTWPTQNTIFDTRPILINIASTDTSNKFINSLSMLNQQTFKSLSELSIKFIQTQTSSK